MVVKILVVVNTLTHTTTLPSPLPHTHTTSDCQQRTKRQTCIIFLKCVNLYQSTKTECSSQALSLTGQGRGENVGKHVPSIS